MNFRSSTLILALFVLGNSSYAQKIIHLTLKNSLEYCASQASQTLKVIPNEGTLPRAVLNGSKEWKFVNYKDWTSVFGPVNCGIYMKLRVIRSGKKKQINLADF